MFDWKIIAAGFIALVVIVSAFAGSIGLGDVFGKIVGKVKGWLANSPLEGFLSTPSAEEARVESISITIWPESFSIVPESLVDIEISQVEMKKFSGEINISFANGTIRLKQTGSEFAVESPVQKMSVSGLEMKRLAFGGRIEMKSGGWEYKSENGSAEILGFSGVMNSEESALKFGGNATKVIRG